MGLKVVLKRDFDDGFLCVSVRRWSTSPNFSLFSISICFINEEFSCWIRWFLSEDTFEINRIDTNNISIDHSVFRSNLLIWVKNYSIWRHFRRSKMTDSIVDQRNCSRQKMKSLVKWKRYRREFLRKNDDLHRSPSDRQIKWTE